MPDRDATNIRVSANTRALEVTLDELTFRRAAARAASQGSNLRQVLLDGLGAWLGDWGTRTISHTVQQGETLGGIAQRYYGQSDKMLIIAAYNEISNPNVIRVGQTLTIPEPVFAPQPPPEPPPLPQGESRYIFGIHDRGGEHLMAWADRRGWVLCTEELGSNPNDWGSRSYKSLADDGFGVLVRLNHGYHENGTLPRSTRYQDFAVRCGNFVQRSSGCHIWIIGNEPNLAWERPGGPANGEPITPDKYVAAFRACRQQIRRGQGHENDQVVVGAVGPWNVQTPYPANPSGDWIVYFQDVLSGLAGELDGIAIHSYARDSDPANIGSDARMDPPFHHRRKMFRTYIDFMEAIPANLRQLPVYMTETNQNIAWDDRSNGWVQEAYAEINRWNSAPGHQQIRCMLLYRWEKHDTWYLNGKEQILNDLRAALRRDYRWRR